VWEGWRLHFECAAVCASRLRQQQQEEGCLQEEGQAWPRHAAGPCLLWGNSSLCPCLCAFVSVPLCFFLSLCLCAFVSVPPCLCLCLCAL